MSRTSAHAAFVEPLRRMGLVAPDEDPAIVPLEGGVSSDIVRVTSRRGTFCVKRALPRLKVAADWEAPVSRNASEVAWNRTVAAIVPEAAVAILGEDREAGLFAMAWLDPGRYPLWKARLRDGIVEPSTARAVGDALGRIHAATADRPDLARAFANDHIFWPIRLEPYLLATAERHPDLAPRLADLARVTGTTKRALVHGDVSPKNIVAGPGGPVFLDAECAWYGDPAFDLAFCLKHLLLKGLWRPAHREAYLECFDAMVAAYLARVAWEPADALEARAAALLPGLFLGRVDGKSPVEYLTEARQKDAVRATARGFLLEPAARLSAIREAWRSAA